MQVNCNYYSLGNRYFSSHTYVSMLHLMDVLFESFYSLCLVYIVEVFYEIQININVNVSCLVKFMLYCGGNACFYNNSKLYLLLILLDRVEGIFQYSIVHFFCEINVFSNFIKYHYF